MACNHKHLALYNQADHDVVPVSLKVFHYNDVSSPKTNNEIPDEEICKALSNMSFNEDVVYCQFWAVIEFGSDAAVLTTRGQPFGFSKHTDEFCSYRIACLGINAYVDRKEEACIGIPGRVYFKGSPEWTRDAREYDEEKYPQREDAMRSNIRGLFAMPVFEGDRCIGVLEFVMTNSKDNFANEMEQVCRVLKEVGLQSSSDQNKWINAEEVGLKSDHNENLDINTSKNRTTGKSRRGKADKITCNDLTNLFGLPKSHVAKKFSVAENTISKAQKKYKIKRWPCESSKTTKSSAYIALINGGAPVTSSDKDRLFKEISSLLMKDRAITRARAPIPETQIDQTAASKTDINHFSYSGSFDMDEVLYDQTTNARPSVPETQIDQTSASNTSWLIQFFADTLEDINDSSDNSFSVEDLPQNTTNHFDNRGADILGWSSIAPIPETQIDQTAATKTDINHFSYSGSFDMDEVPCEQTTNARASVPETQIDQTAASNTIWPFQTSVDIDVSDYYVDADTFELREQTINARASVHETQINQTAAASENRSLEFSVEPLQNTTNDITRNMEFEHPGAGLIMPEYDEMISLIYGTSVPETQIDQAVASNTSWLFQIPVDTPEDINGSSYNLYSVDNHSDNRGADILGWSSIAPIPETQIDQTAASMTDINHISYSGSCDMDEVPYEQTTNSSRASVPEIQIPVYTPEDLNGFSYNLFPVEDLLQNTTNHFDNRGGDILGWSSIAPIPETQIDQTAASKTNINHFSYSGSCDMDGVPYEQTTNASRASVHEIQILVDTPEDINGFS